MKNVLMKGMQQIFETSFGTVNSDNFQMSDNTELRRIRRISTIGMGCFRQINPIGTRRI